LPRQLPLDVHPGMKRFAFRLILSVMFLPPARRAETIRCWRPVRKLSVPGNRFHFTRKFPKYHNNLQA
jgi:hypothetical protein